MKRKIIMLLAVFCLGISSAVYGDSLPPVTFPIQNDPGDEKPDSHRHRMPPAPIMCIIDFEAKTVVFTSSTIEGIYDYQVYEADEEICVGSYGDTSEFVDALGSLSGNYCIRFITPKETFTGYINL
ncbi:MAG: hypothetical protein K2H84_02255 [Paramuribaculum sp.]|nr:hypothetical protein [Paramuribaculum sp.]